jgi:hypothetical protein
MSAYPLSPCRALLAVPALALLLAAGPTTALRAQSFSVDATTQAPDDNAALPPVDQLVAPVALYPDPLLSLVLPASTFPDQVQQAAAYLQQGGSPDQLGSMGWDSSVQGLAHYPSVIEWMGSNADWTSQLGGAFASQPDQVMDAVQDLRRRAQAVGTLVDTPQQRILSYNGEIEIVPAQDQTIYVPQYDPSVVFVQQPPGFYAASYFAWSQPYPAGVWLTFDFDWRDHAVWQGDWYDYQRRNGGWSHPVDYSRFKANGSVRINNQSYSGWHAPRNAPARPPQFTAGASAQTRFAQPKVMTGAPKAPGNAARVNTMVVNRGERPAPRPAAASSNQAQARSRPAEAQPGSNQRPAAQPEQPRPAVSEAARTEPSAQQRTPSGFSEASRAPTPEPRERAPAAESRVQPQERAQEANAPRAAASETERAEPSRQAPAAESRPQPQERAPMAGEQRPASVEANRAEPSRAQQPAKPAAQAAKPKPAGAPKEEAPKEKKDDENPPK